MGSPRKEVAVGVARGDQDLAEPGRSEQRHAREPGAVELSSPEHVTVGGRPKVGFDLDQGQFQVLRSAAHRFRDQRAPPAVVQRHVEPVHVDQRVQAVAMAKHAVEAVDAPAEEAGDAATIGLRGRLEAGCFDIDRSQLSKPRVEDLLGGRQTSQQPRGHRRRDAEGEPRPHGDRRRGDHEGLVALVRLHSDNAVGEQVVVPVERQAGGDLFVSELEPVQASNLGGGRGGHGAGS